MFRIVPVVLFLALVASAASTWPETLPSLKLKDPLDAEFTDAHFKPRGLVLVATSPIESQGRTQQAWHAELSTHVDRSGPALVMLEDLSQSWFRPLVLAKMREEYRRGAPIVLLLDESGATRRAFGVAENATVAFAFDRSGKLAAVETGAPTPERTRKLLDAARR